MLRCRLDVFYIDYLMRCITFEKYEYIYSFPMKKYFILIALVFQMLHGQTITFSEHISPIIYNKCTSCHRPGEIGPMPFTNYQQVKAYGAMIAAVTQSGYMPPWPPDPSYSTLIGERTLTAQEKNLIAQWVAQGMAQGNPALEAQIPSFPSGSFLGIPDTVIPMAQSYTINDNNKDEYRVFVLPSGLQQDRYLRAMEFRPGNAQIVHHAIVMSESTGIGILLDQADTTGYGYASFGGFNIPNNQLDEFHLAWAPGMQPDFYPSSVGQKIKANANLLLQIHYAPSILALSDSSYLNLFFHSSPPPRQVITQQWAFPGLFLPANQRTTVTRMLTIPNDISLLSIAPHAHLLGESWEIYAVKPDNDTVKILRIPDWDFNWQGQYKPEKLIKLPKFTKIYATCVYDNRASNPRNPNNPPKNVTWGENTSDEMFYILFQYLNYQPGDENIPLSTRPDLLESVGQVEHFHIFPNPAFGQITIQFFNPTNQKVRITLRDVSGRVVNELVPLRAFSYGVHRKNVEIQNLPRGIFVAEMTTEEGSHFFRKIILK